MGGSESKMADGRLAASLDIAASLADQGKHDEALKKHMEILSVKKKQYGKDALNEDIASTMVNIATTMMSLKNYKEAANLLQQVMDMLKSIFGDEKHIRIAQTLLLMSENSLGQGDREQAKEHLNKAVEAVTFCQDSNALSISVAMQKIANIFKKLGDTSKALEWYQKALVKREACGATPMDTATTLCSIGECYQEMEQFRVALNHFTQARKKLDDLEMTNNLSQGLHINSHDVKKELAKVLDHEGECHTILNNLEDALKAFNPCLEIKKELKEGIAAMSSLLKKIAKVFSKLGKHQEALEKHQEALELKRQHYGTDAQNESIASSLVNIGCEWMELKKHEEADKFLQEALKMLRAVFPDKKSIRIVQTLLLLSENAFAKGDRPKSEKHLKEATEAVEDSQGCADLSQAGAMRSIGNMFTMLGELPKAMKWYMKGQEKQEAEGATPLDLATTLYTIGSCSQEMKQYENALEHYKEAKEKLKALEMTSNVKSNIVHLLNNEGLCHHYLNNFEEALSAYRESIATAEGIDDKESSKQILSWPLNNIGIVLSKQGKHKEALEHHLKALETKRSEGEESGQYPTIASSLYNIGNIHMSLKNYEEAGKFLQESLELRQGDKTDICGATRLNGDKNDIWVTDTLKLLGKNSLALGDLKEAERYLEEAAEAVKGCHSNAEIDKSNLENEIKGLLQHVKDPECSLPTEMKELPSGIKDTKHSTLLRDVLSPRMSQLRKSARSSIRKISKRKSTYTPE